MSHNKVLCISFVVVAMLAGKGFSSQPQSVAEILREHHIAVDTDGLIQALQNSDTDIRGFAALELSSHKTIAAVSAIEDALNGEPVTRTRIRMALALSLLGDKQGVEVLKDTCTNSRTLPAFRTIAASYLLDADSSDSSCLDAILNLLESDHDSRIGVLGILRKFTNLSEDQSRRIYISVMKSLMDSEPAVRLAASHACVDLGDGAAIPELQRAIASEGNPDVRRGMENELGRLQQKLQAKKEP